MTEGDPETDPVEYRIRWTKHPDAFPELTHCPSCGEPVDVPWDGDAAPMDRPVHSVPCEQCERDLRLPSYAVKDQLCILCKIPAEEADDAVDYHRLETGERICSNCAGDLRSFKYELAIQHFVADWVTDDHRRDLMAAVAEVSEAHGAEYSFTFNANAKYGRMEPEPDDDLTVKDLLQDAPDEIPDEFRAVPAEDEEGDEAGEEEADGGE